MMEKAKAKQQEEEMAMEDEEEDEEEEDSSEYETDSEEEGPGGRVMLKPVFVPKVSSFVHEFHIQQVQHFLSY